MTPTGRLRNEYESDDKQQFCHSPAFVLGKRGPVVINIAVLSCYRPSNGLPRGARKEKAILHVMNCLFTPRAACPLPTAKQGTAIPCNSPGIPHMRCLETVPSIWVSHAAAFVIFFPLTGYVGRMG